MGLKAPPWIQQGVDQYVSRMKRECRFSVVEIRGANRNKPAPVSLYINQEGQKIKESVSSGARVIAMDRRGKNWNTEQFARKIQNWSQMTNHFQFLIGGPDGLADDCIDQADEVFALSELTFPHFLVRVMLAEQIYRALMLNANHPYHK